MRYFQALAMVALAFTAVSAQDADQRDSLNKQNEARRQATRSTGVNRPDLVWDNALADDARAWAQYMKNTGIFDHDHNNWKREGENLAAGYSSVSGATVDWINEHVNYQCEPIGRGDFFHYGHYTQIIYPYARRVGVARVDGGKAGSYEVARFDVAQLTDMNACTGVCEGRGCGKW